MNTPFYMSSMLLLLAGSLGILCGSLISKWMFVVIFMIFLGGMMILFFYVVSLAKPKKNLFSMNYLWFMVILLLMVIFSFEKELILSKFLAFQVYNYLSLQVLIYLTILLFITLFSVVKISENFKGSMVSSW